MNLGEFREKTKHLPDSLDLFITQTDTEFPLSLLVNAEVKNVLFADGKLKAKDDVLVLTDEA